MKSQTQPSVLRGLGTSRFEVCPAWGQRNEGWALAKGHARPPGLPVRGLQLLGNVCLLVRA